MKTSLLSRRAFTLIELMIVVAIIGILAAVAIPKFSDLLRKSKEGATKGNLGRLRSALSIYYGDMEGLYPSKFWQSNSTVLDSLVPKYINQIPKVHPANHHAPTNSVFCHQTYDWSHDGSGWGYDGAYDWGPDSNFGRIWVFCSHTDSKGTQWWQY